MDGLLYKVETFLKAAGSDDLDSVAVDLAHGLSADVMDDDHVTALQIASAQGNLTMMEILLKAGASVDNCNHCGFTPLLHAARNGKAQAVELLINHGADTLRTTFYGTSALSLASAGGHLDTIIILREYQNQTRRHAPTPLIAAIARNQYETVIYLEFFGMIQHPCRDMFYEIDAFSVAKSLMDLKMMTLLRDLRLQPQNQMLIGSLAEEELLNEVPCKTPDIRCLIRGRCLSLLDWILNLNNYKELPEGTTPLMYASVVQLILRYTCDINATCCGFTALMIALVSGNDLLSQYLIRKGASQNGISPATIQLILTGEMPQLCLTRKISALLGSIFRWIGKSNRISHQQVKLTENGQQPSFVQKVEQNMGVKSSWVPQKLIDALAWPEYFSTSFPANFPINNHKSTPKRLVNVDPNQSSDVEVARVYSDCFQEHGSSISKLRSALFHFGNGPPKNISDSSVCSSDCAESVGIISTTNTLQETDVPLIENLDELCSAYAYEEKYWNLLSRRCSPAVCLKLQQQEVDYETFLMLTKAEFISFGINRSDANILGNLQKKLREELGITAA
ncbi:unnamed protein product [Thelazia callipaeda]|uniref:ANK_REP_REGION domain-containing protein n=1 Tax=Thelazia callipaeda TaxID=103827 RepID=A0A0N5D2A3_THECL|nr:unnamed protein product [Thelazia callipaeda]